MDLSDLRLKPVNIPLVGFGGSKVVLEGIIDLLVSIGEEPTRKTCMIQFLVVDSPFAYNAVLGRLGLNIFRALVSTYHLKLKFLTKGGEGEVRCDQKEARQCDNLLIKNSSLEKTKDKRKVGDQGGENEEIKKMKSERIEPIEEYKEIELLPGELNIPPRLGHR
ncbi:UNVERIFIED_CONTAM: hypothetical protein Sradi_5614000 [Sesamum radiatum]|uniref:Uncharacterized protein n=1 Tax=Sesamum radiatum TaxID=300843 RepID=A0AAW2L032_SESRA